MVLRNWAAGMNELYSKSGLLISGIGQLDAGSKKLNDGMSQFYKEGIGKIVSLYNDKLKGTVNNAESLVAAGKAYNTFTQVPGRHGWNRKIHLQNKGC